MDDIQIELTTIQLSEHQAEFLDWCNRHYKQLLDLKRCGYLDKGGRSFTVHLKQSLEVDKIDLHDHYYPV